jgi:hypothetical protein
MTIRREALEISVLNGLRSHLMEPELLKAFSEEFTREVNRLRIERDAEIIERRKEIERIDRELEKAIQAILDGVPGAMLKDKTVPLKIARSSSRRLWSSHQSRYRFFIRIWRRSIVSGSRSYATAERFRGDAAGSRGAPDTCRTNPAYA